MSSVVNHSLALFAVVLSFDEILWHAMSAFRQVSSIFTMWLADR